MRKFYLEVNKRSRNEMIAYLSGHFRYNTMNSWNHSTSYAHNLKVYNLGLDKAIEGNLYQMINVREFYDRINGLMGDFGLDHGYQWQAKMNGRSEGYLVLYQGCKEISGYKSYCTGCGQQNYKSVSETGNICGRCHEPARVDYPSPHMRVVLYPGRGTDDTDDFEDWLIDDLRDRVSLVQEFDKLADGIVAEAVELATHFQVREEIYLSPQTRLTLAPINQREA